MIIIYESTTRELILEKVQDAKRHGSTIDYIELDAIDIHKLYSEDSRTHGTEYIFKSINDLARCIRRKQYCIHGVLMQTTKGNYL